MDSKLKDSICGEVYRRFPEMKEIQPKIKSYDNGLFLLIFQGKAKAGDGLTIPRTVRVVADQNGKIKKVTTSR